MMIIFCIFQDSIFLEMMHECVFLCMCVCKINNKQNNFSWRKKQVLKILSQYLYLLKTGYIDYKFE